MVYAQPGTCPRKWQSQTPVGLWYTNGSPNLGPKTRFYNNQPKKKKKRKKICKIVDFVVPAGHRIKLKECEKRDKYLDLARELKKLWNMKVTIIPIVICAFGTVIKGLLKGLEDFKVGDRIETIQTRALLKTARILRRVLESSGVFEIQTDHLIPARRLDLMIIKKHTRNNIVWYIMKSWWKRKEFWS